MQDRPLIDETAREALRQACASLDGAERAANSFAMSQALAEVARCYQNLGANALAESYFEKSLRWARFAGGNDLVVELMCELAHVLAGLALEQDEALPGSGHAARERARDHAFEAATRAGGVTDSSCEARWLLRVSEVLEFCGDRADAEQVHTRALRMMAECPRVDAHAPNHSTLSADS